MSNIEMGLGTRLCTYIQSVERYTNCYLSSHINCQYRFEEQGSPLVNVILYNMKH